LKKTVKIHLTDCPNIGSIRIDFSGPTVVSTGVTFLDVNHDAGSAQHVFIALGPLNSQGGASSWPINAPGPTVTIQPGDNIWQFTAQLYADAYQHPTAGTISG
ncbi:fimbrial protein, partial [Lelliottia nimipressuralis]|uniref:fimbrial protein n=1 Tax=Lelliottia nimipressuralis TaxID=69220 RepID=UPI001E46B345